MPFRACVVPSKASHHRCDDAAPPATIARRNRHPHPDRRCARHRGGPRSLESTMARLISPRGRVRLPSKASHRGDDRRPRTADRWRWHPLPAEISLPACICCAHGFAMPDFVRVSLGRERERVLSSPVHNRRGAVWLLAPNKPSGGGRLSTQSFRSRRRRRSPGPPHPPVCMRRIP